MGITSVSHFLQVLRTAAYAVLAPVVAPVRCCGRSVLGCTCAFPDHRRQVDAADGGK